jgi:hypothetical protein
MGFGQCDAPDKPTSASGGSLTVTADATTIYAGNSSSTPHSAMITINGGTPNYTLTLYPTNTSFAYFTSGTSPVSSITINSSSITLTAQPTLSTSTPITVIVSDSSSPIRTGNTIITLRP